MSDCACAVERLGGEEVSAPPDPSRATATARSKGQLSGYHALAGMKNFSAGN